MDFEKQQLQAEQAVVPTKPRKSKIALFVIVILLAILIVGGWLYYQNYKLLTSTKTDLRASNSQVDTLTKITDDELSTHSISISA